MVPPKTSARKVCMDVCETKAQSSEPVPSASAIRDTDTRKTWRADSPAGRRPPDAVAAWLGWRDGATSYQAFARMSECMSGLHFDQIEGHFPLLFFPIRAKKREIFQCFYESSYSEAIKWASKQIRFKSPLFSVSKYVFDSEYYKTRRNFALREKWKSWMQFECVLLATENWIFIVCFTDILSLLQFLVRKFEFSKSVGLALICLFSLPMPMEVHLSPFFFNRSANFENLGQAW